MDLVSGPAHILIDVGLLSPIAAVEVCLGALNGNNTGYVPSGSARPIDDLFNHLGLFFPSEQHHNERSERIAWSVHAGGLPPRAGMALLQPNYSIKMESAGMQVPCIYQNMPTYLHYVGQLVETLSEPFSLIHTVSAGAMESDTWFQVSDRCHVRSARNWILLTL
jgi:hypothetical protein